MKILVFGSFNIDHTFKVDQIVKPGETIKSVSLIKGAGGKGANQAVALAKAGMSVYMAGKMGRDGKFIQSLLQSYGVNTDNIIEYDGATGQAIIQVDKNGQNAIVIYGGGNDFITQKEILKVLSKFKGGDIIVLQNETANVAKMINVAYKRKLLVCLNPSPYNEKIKKMPLHKVNIFFVNEIEGAHLANVPLKTNPKLIIHRLMQHFTNSEIILTIGKRGAYYGLNSIVYKINAVNAPVVDTVGAGDTFLGYFIASRVNKFNVKESLQFASKAASITISHKGSIQSMPSKDEVFNM